MSIISDVIDSYFGAHDELCDVFGYQHDWRVFPFSDERDSYWMLTSEENGSLVTSRVPFTKESVEEGKKIFTAKVYTYRHLKKWVYRRDGHVLVLADTQTDGNVFLFILDESKECKDEALIQCAKDCWC